MTQLCGIEGSSLIPLESERLNSEEQLENWLELDIAILDPDLLLIGRQIKTPHGGRIDLLATNSDGSLSIIELKRDRTPRDIVAQILDYASWVADLDTPTIHAIAENYWIKRGSSFAGAFQEKFESLSPEPLNITHNMVIVASALDPASQRIVEYLSQFHDVGINTAFFTVFVDGERRYFAADWLMDQEEVVERTERRTRAPWTGLKYVNAGESEHRSWADMCRYGFVAAGHGRQWSSQLSARLAPDDVIFVYQKGHGYVGHGVVTSPAVMAKDFNINGTCLLDCSLSQPGLAHNRDDEDLAEYVVGVRWLKTLSVSEAKSFPGAFASQHVVCKLRDQTTISFLEREFLDNS